MSTPAALAAITMAAKARVGEDIKKPAVQPEWKPEPPMYGVANPAKRTSATLESQQHTSSPHRYWWLHGSEKVAGETLGGLGKRGTTINTLAKGRYWKVKGLKVDPNRWLTPAGAENHIRRANPRASNRQIQNTLESLNFMRETWLPTMRPGKGGAIISAHNSHPHARYKGGKTIFEHELTKPTMDGKTRLTKAAHLGDADKVDFIIVTDRNDYDAAVSGNAPFNVFYQPFDWSAKDDGSASYLAGVEGWRYFNPEVSLREGAREKQKAMIDWIETLNQ
tara:strand:+ start:366 stop:1202 length:837 start_codon:yes stop_codon:yes gene_type:complete